MNRVITAFSLVSLIFGLACGPSVQTNDYEPVVAADASPPGEPDAILGCGNVDPSLGLADCDGYCVSLLQNVDHCGACNRSCDRRYANSCNDGNCGCGDGLACAEGTLCVSIQGHSICVTPDTSGAPCDGVDVMCEQPGAVCADGHCTIPECQEWEVCNGYDDNCNGYVDENSDLGPIAEYCYSGPAGTEGIGPCSGGWRVCRDGVMSACEDEVTPVPETGLLSCDAVDNDCNGCADGEVESGECVNGPPLLVDIVFYIDTSGSMSDNIAAVKTAVGTFSESFEGNDNIHLCIEEISGDPTIRVHHPCSDFTAFEAALGTLGEGGGDEPTYDAVWKTENGDFSDPSDVTNFLNLRPDALRLNIVFSDEAAQTHLSLTESDVCNKVSAGGSILAVFTEPEFWPDWDECGLLYELSPVDASLLASLEDVFESPCVGGP